MLRILKLCFLLVLMAGCSSAPMMEFSGLSAPARIDGQAAEWAGGIRYVEQAGLSVGANPGADALDLIIVTADPHLQMQILTLGLTIWLDGNGGKEQSFGLRYPAPELDGGLRPGQEAGDRRERLEQMLAGLSGDFLLLEDEDDEGRLMMAGGRAGFDLAMGLDGPRLVHELHIPLAGEDRDARSLMLGGELLGLGLIVTPPEKESLEDQTSSMASSMGSGSGGPGRRGGGQGGRGGNTSGGPRRSTPDWLDAWVMLRLN